MALLLGGCASADGIAGNAPVAAAGGVESTGTPATNSAASATGASRAAPVLPGREKEPEKAYPSFGAPAQVGDRPVLTKEQSAAMQKNLEGLASDREKTMLRQIEADQ